MRLGYKGVIFAAAAILLFPTTAFAQSLSSVDVSIDLTSDTLETPIIDEQLSQEPSAPNESINEIDEIENQIEDVQKGALLSQNQDTAIDKKDEEVPPSCEFNKPIETVSNDNCPSILTDETSQDSSSAEQNRYGWVQQDDNCVYYDLDGSLHSGWLVTDNASPITIVPGLQRYWLDIVTGFLQRNTVVSIDENGIKYYAYALADGTILRGAFDSGSGFVYLADNDGRLDSSDGWSVTGAYTGGQLQRYWFDAELHAAKSGDFSVEGENYYGVGGVGYVLRGAGDGRFADNDGRLASNRWVVTSAFGQGLQRYWFAADGKMAIGRLVDEIEYSQYYAYALADGTILRGAFDSGSGFVYLADNDGRLDSSDGWSVTGAYTGGQLQRYWFDAELHAAKSGLFKVAGDWYWGNGGVGYVLRGAGSIDNRVAYANNEGILLANFTSNLINKNGSISQLSSQPIAGKTYLFLPSYASLSNLSLISNDYGVGSTLLWADSESGAFAALSNESVINATLLSTDEAGGHVLYYRRADSSAVLKLSVILSGDIRTVYVVSADPSKTRPYTDGSPDHSTKASVVVVVVDPDGSIVYANDDIAKGNLSTIKGRGNSSWGLSNKKPYQIKLSKKTDLLRTGNSDNKSKTWILLANSNDPTLIRDLAGYNVALELGLIAPECAPVDFYYDGEYRGNYLLCEKVEIGSGRVDIDDLEDAYEEANSGVDLSALPTATGVNSYGQAFQYVVGIMDPANVTNGGFLLEFDNAYYSSEVCWFATTQGYVVVKSPEFSSYTAMKYISELFQRGITSIVEGGAVDVFDIDSFAKTYLVNQYMKNLDYGGSSTYFYTNGGSGVLYAGPVWDLDACCGTRTDWFNDDGLTYWGIVSGNTGWVINNSQISSKVRDIWTGSFSSIAHAILEGNVSAKGVYLHSLSFYIDSIASSQKMDQVLWGIGNFNNQIDAFRTWERCVSYLQTWLSDRTKWLDGAVTTWADSPVTDNQAVWEGNDWGLVFDA